MTGIDREFPFDRAARITALPHRLSTANFGPRNERSIRALRLGTVGFLER